MNRATRASARRTRRAFASRRRVAACTRAARRRSGACSRSRQSRCSASLLIGSVPVSFAQALHALMPSTSLHTVAANAATDDMTTEIVRTLRVPRALGGFAGGPLLARWGALGRGRGARGREGRMTHERCADRRAFAG
ncbi:hypothetical protein [Paraburkholderia sp. Ac-20347]|uniref:hypothetical protein n=1 Tax=Paraburkholderia sp. Ac-20347 TaxID=2703892 RepID=UPI00197EE8C6|nr:hypothetical protein [Paraburkholderia sp. Ac-20347]